MVDYKNTLNLPQTEFSMRAGLARKEPALLATWESEQLYAQIGAARQDAPRFVLHDGPPYANGHLHHGHILNKILKDLVVKYQTMRGHRVDYVPGWDCHGLPIEVQVDKELGAKKASLSKAEVRTACRAYADRFVDIQREEFKRLGVLGRWENPYKTMSFGYEAAILRELARFAEAGLLYKGLRTVNWCPIHQTALAEAEVEYEDKTSPSIYVAMPIVRGLENVQTNGLPLHVVIWTTTPWTLPANMAVAVHADETYVAYALGDKACLIAEALLESALQDMGEKGVDPDKILARLQGQALGGAFYRHPLFERESPIVIGDHVTMDAGTGCVHTAPGHGADDFELGRKVGLEILNPVDGRGVFKSEAGRYAGKKAFACNEEIIADLQAEGALLSDPDLRIQHRYPHCWRCHKPIMLRATEQWWVAMDTPFSDGPTLRERALNALPEVHWIPRWGQERIHGMLATRPDWCLSRQRTWGVPIAVVYCDACDHAIVDPERMRRVAESFESHGADAWFTHSVEELMGEDLSCPKCGGRSFRKEEDILDVWFDSGVSFAAVIEREGLGHAEGAPVDLYLEGSDQHRGWFHSSLLCALGTRGHAPYRNVLTHGFVVDGQGKKISKSKGNFVDPFKAIEKDGAEVLRLWVAGEEYRDDIRISNEILNRLSDMYRKLRNTLRFGLGNLHGFEPQRDLVSPEDLLPIDAYALVMLQRSLNRIEQAYGGYTFHQVVQQINEFATVDLSAFYFDLLKDRLYASAPNSRERRSAQTAIFIICRALVRAMAPVLCFTAEEAWRQMPRFDSDPHSVHLAFFPGMAEGENEAVLALMAGVDAQAEALERVYGELRRVRKEVNAVLEEARRSKTIGSSVEACANLQCGSGLFQRLNDLGAAVLEEVLIVSQVTLRQNDALAADGVEIGVSKAAGRKCPRCWLYREEVEVAQPVCGRCHKALAELPQEVVA